MKCNRFNLTLGVVLAAMACSAEPDPIQFGVQECAHCRMTIADPRFAAQLQTRQGRVYGFDAVECLARFVQGNDLDDGARFWVYSYLPPERRIEAPKAFFLASEGLPSPMGGGLSAYASQTDADAQQAAHGGRVLTWEQLIDHDVSPGR